MTTAGWAQTSGSTARAHGGRVTTLPVRETLLTLAFALLLIFAFLGPFTSASGLPLTGEGSPLRQGTYILAAVLILVALRPIAAPARLVVVPVAIVAALAWCWISLAWAIAPSIGARRLVLTTLIIWSSFAATRALGYERSMFVVRIVFVIALIVNYATVFTLPTIGIHQVSEPFDKALVGDWRGIMTHKNHAGAVCGLTILAFLIDARRIPMAVRAAVIAAAAYFLIRTGSRTSLADTLGTALLGVLFLTYRAKYRSLVLPGACVLLLIAGTITNFYADPLAGLLQQKRTLSGRLDIWDALLRYSADNRLLGAGYGSFWNIGSDSPIYRYGKGWVADLAMGHNGFLDLLVTIGIPGLVLVLAATVVVPLVRLFGHAGATGPRGALLLATVVFCITHNSTESSLFDRDGIAEVFLMVAIGLIWTITSSDRTRGTHAQAFGARSDVARAIDR